MRNNGRNGSNPNALSRGMCALLLGAAVLVSGAAAAMIHAPYLPRLATERYPQLNWPSPGSFARVNGGAVAPVETDLGAGQIALDARGRQMFKQKGGKALLVFQGGRLKFAHYAAGVGPNTRLNSYSMIKSLVGALVLRAHAQEYIRRLHDPIGAYLPNTGDAEFRKTPILSLLRMRSGVIFEAGAGKSAVGQGEKDIEAMRMNPFGPMARLHMLGLHDISDGLRAKANDRGQYKYQNVNTSILGALLEKVYRQPLQEILSEQIWRPAGAATAYWRRHGKDLPVTAYCCLFATPADWVKVGNFLISNGGSSGQFLPKRLWRRYFGLDLSYVQVQNDNYGLHIYHNVLDRAGERLQGQFSYLLGSRGQVLYLMPDKQLVVVRFGEQIQLLHTTLYSAWNTVHRH